MHEWHVQQPCGMDDGFAWWQGRVDCSYGRPQTYFILLGIRSLQNSCQHSSIHSSYFGGEMKSKPCIQTSTYVFYVCLQVLPSLLRRRLHKVAQGIFLHSAFPSSEIFRAFPKREELLRSLLNADVIGFHTFDYARHFISCCSRMLGLEHHTKRGSILMTYYGRDVHLKILPTCASQSLSVSLNVADSYWKGCGGPCTMFW